MSRLIRENQRSSPKTQSAQSSSGDGTTSLSVDLIKAHLKRCESMTLDIALKHFGRFQPHLFEAFNVAIDNARSNHEVSELSGLHRQFRQNWIYFEETYLEGITENFNKFKDKTLGVEESLDLDFDSLCLVENQALEESIAVKTMTTKIDSVLVEPLWALNQRFSILNDGQRVEDKNNPVAPAQFCEALLGAVHVIPSVESRAINIVLTAFADCLDSLAKEVIDELNAYLIESDILPNLKFSQTKPQIKHGGVDSASAADIAEVLGGQEIPMIDLPGVGESPQVYQLSLVDAIRGIQQQVGIGSGEQVVGVQPVGSDGSVAVITVPQVQAALQHIQMPSVPVASDGNLHNISVAPSVSNLPSFMSGIEQQLQSQGVSGAFAKKDSHTIDFVGMLFEYMLKDDAIPDSVKAILSYLHTPFLKIAFSDPHFFEQSDHPARVLLNTLADAGSRWVGNDGTAQYDVLSKIKHVVDHILQDYKSDLGVVRSLLLEFEEFTKSITRRQELMETRAAERAKGEQKLREVKIHVNEVIQGRTAGQQLPSPVLLFLLQPWSDYMSFVSLRYGDDSAVWQRAIGVVDDVIWAIEPQDDPEDVMMQKQLQDRMIASIENGLDTIGFDQVKGARLIESISSLVDLAINAKKPEPAPEEVRAKLEQMAAEKAGNHQAEAEAFSEQERKVVEHLKLIEYGTWFEFEGGKRLKVAWFNRRTMHYMMVDQMGKKVATMSGPDLARDIIARRARMLSGSSKPFFERALENIFANLSQKEDTNDAKGAL